VQETYKIGNAQWIGSRHMQSSYFASKCSETAVMAVLADGTIDHINGRRCAVLAVEACIREFGNMPDAEFMAAYFECMARKILRDMHELIYAGKQPFLSLDIQVILRHELFYYHAGNSRMFLFDGTSLKLLEGRSGSAAFGRGWISGLLSQGFWEALHEKELVSYLCEKGHPYEKAQKMLSGVIQKNRKQAGNAAAVLIEDCL